MTKLLEHGTAKLRLEEVFLRQCMERVIFGLDHELEIAVPQIGDECGLSGVQYAHDGAMIRSTAILGMLKAIHQVDFPLNGFHNVENGNGFGGLGQGYAALRTGDGFEQSGFGELGHNAM